MNTNQLKFWQTMQAQAAVLVEAEPLMAELGSSFNEPSIEQGVVYHLSRLVESDQVKQSQLVATFATVVDKHMIDTIISDIVSCYERDPACKSYVMPWLFFKGFQALQLHRIAHQLYKTKHRSLAIWVQHQVARNMGVDIHPNAQIGSGIMIDHATALVIGETAVVGNNVSILHSVTLGGSGLEAGQRHPQVGNDVLISAGAKLLGDIRVGDGAKIAAGSLVVDSIAPMTTVAGVPARVVGATKQLHPGKKWITVSSVALTNWHR